MHEYFGSFMVRLPPWFPVLVRSIAAVFSSTIEDTLAVAVLALMLSGKRELA